VAAAAGGGPEGEGLVVLETKWVPAGTKGGKRVVTNAYSGFNTAAWFANVGVFKPSNCSGAAPPLPS
jgi:hypothetical protein